LLSISESNVLNASEADFRLRILPEEKGGEIMGDFIFVIKLEDAGNGEFKSRFITHSVRNLLVTRVHLKFHDGMTVVNFRNVPPMISSITFDGLFEVDARKELSDRHDFSLICPPTPKPTLLPKLRFITNAKRVISNTPAAETIQYCHASATNPAVFVAMS